MSDFTYHSKRMCLQGGRMAKFRFNKHISISNGFYFALGNLQVFAVLMPLTVSQPEFQMTWQTKKPRKQKKRLTKRAPARFQQDRFFLPIEFFEIFEKYQTPPVTLKEYVFKEANTVWAQGWKGLYISGGKIVVCWSGWARLTPNCNHACSFWTRTEGKQNYDLI